ncbi:MAG: hypothetical protein KatS3mg014_2676 [Actinomycetota bacterium]|nr:MAG: hypothetical protein KatS3mg014_2676 [Actinomycetota bacterium]
MTQFGPRPRRGVLLAFFVALGVLAGHLLSGAAPSVARAASAPLKELSLFTEVYHLITSKYVDTSVLEPRGLIEGAIYGMVDRLADPHTHFLPPEPAEELTIETEGEFSGVGIEINMENGIPTVVSPIEGMPAWEAGLAAGDRIVAVDGEPTEGLSLTEVVKRIRGPVNTPVDLTILRPSLEDSFVVRIVRQVIRVRSVKGTIHDGDLAYIRIVNFTERTPDELDAVWERLRAKNPRGVILDLRSNPGGVLPSAVAVADRFLETGVIVSIRGRDPAMRQTFYASRGPTYPNLPLVVLVNGGSASASEIVTGAVRDHGRGKAIGQKTYGKGSVQSVFPLSDGSKLALTTALYYTALRRLHPQAGNRARHLHSARHLYRGRTERGEGPDRRGFDPGVRPDPHDLHPRRRRAVPQDPRRQRHRRPASRRGGTPRRRDPAQPLDRGADPLPAGGPAARPPPWPSSARPSASRPPPARPPSGPTRSDGARAARSWRSRPPATKRPSRS